LGAGKAHENIIQMLFTCKVGEEEFIGLEFFEGDMHIIIQVIFATYNIPCILYLFRLITN